MSRRFALPVRAPQAYATERRLVVLEPQGSLGVEGALAAPYLPGTARAEQEQDHVHGRRNTARLQR